MTLTQAAQQIADALNIERGDAIELIEDYALNTREVESIDEITDVTEARVREIIADALDAREEAAIAAQEAR